MARWIVGDVLRWTEPDWFQKGKGRRKKEFFKKGERTVSAQVRSIEGDWVELKVLRCEVVSDRSARGVHRLKGGEVIARKGAVLQKRGAERIAWGGADGERARLHVVAKSKFLS